MEPIHLTLPLPPALTNSSRGRSRHWRALEKEKITYWELLDLYRSLKRIPPPPLQAIEYAEASAVMYLWNPMDDGNALARLKWLEDWLVRRGYLRGDRRKNLRWLSLPDQVIDRQNPRVELTLTPRPSPAPTAAAGAKRSAGGRRSSRSAPG